MRVSPPSTYGTRYTAAWLTVWSPEHRVCARVCVQACECVVFVSPWKSPVSSPSKFPAISSRFVEAKLKHSQKSGGRDAHTAFPPEVKLSELQVGSTSASGGCWDWGLCEGGNIAAFAHNSGRWSRDLPFLIIWTSQWSSAPTPRTLLWRYWISV